MSITILDVSATKVRNKQIISRFISSYRRKKRNFQPEMIGAGCALRNPRTVSMTKKGRVSIKEQ